MKKKITVTVGIPAYNEQQNIGHLLVSILNQKTRFCVVEKIIVVSDGSTDGTVQAVRRIDDRRIECINRTKRRGLNQTQNEILRLTKSDVLVLLNADVLLGDDSFIDNTVEPLLADKSVGLVGVNSRCIYPQTLTERILGNSHILKTYMYKRINKGENVFMCHGVARAFSKALYSKLRWPKNTPEDSYSYFFAKKLGFKFVYSPKALVLFRSPSNIKDHVRQSARFRSGINTLEKHFGKETLNREFKIPLSLFIEAYVRLFPRRAFSLTSYIFLQVYTVIVSRNTTFFKDKHDISISTKRLISYNLAIASFLDRFGI